MARGLFDLIHAYNQGSPEGYAPFQPGYIDPMEALEAQSRAQLQSQPGAGPALAGQAIGGFLRGLGRKGVAAYRARKPEVRGAAALGGAVNSALNEKTARIMQDNPRIDAREAIIAAANELYASTAGSKQDPAFRDMVRNSAMLALRSMGEFDPEAQKKFAEAKKLRAEASEESLGNLKNFVDPTSGKSFTFPENVAARLIQDPRFSNLQLVDTPAARKPGDTVTSFVGDKRLTRTFDPEGEVTGLTPRPGGWVTEIADARAAAGGPAAEGDTSSKADLSKRDNEYMTSFAALQQANFAIDEIIKVANAAEAKGIKGTTGTVGSIYRFLGEVSSVVQAGASLAKDITTENLGNPKVYADGTMTYAGLTDPNKYEEEFKHFGEGFVASKRVQASIINLAYMFAIAQESSARAISDNDIKLRLQTLGADISSGKGFRQILEDRRKQMFFDMKARLDNDKTFSSDEFYRKRYEELSEPYNLDTGVGQEISKSTRAHIRVTPRGVEITR